MDYTHFDKLIDIVLSRNSNLHVLYARSLKEKECFERWFPGYEVIVVPQCRFYEKENKNAYK